MTEVTTTLDVSAYYPGLLILQYIGRPRASATIKALCDPVMMPQTSIQTLTFSAVPSSGSFQLTYNGLAPVTINWNDSNATIQTALRTVSGLSLVTVAGSIASQLLTVTFTGVTPPAYLLAASANTLSPATTIAIVDTDLTLPLAVSNGFNLSGSSIAAGVQLDILAKYVGVSRTALGATSTIVLSDADLLTLIQIAIIKNSSGSSLSVIQSLIHQFFADNMLVFDRTDMSLAYFISSAAASTDLLDIFVTEDLLPRPMAVSVVIIYAPVINNFFSFRTYTLPAYNASPFNSYASYQTTRPWLTYAEAHIP